jgi:tetratricopeptide (TPR) repeat protein
LGDSYDRDLTDIFAIQSEIAQQEASRLRAELSAEERKEIHEKPTDNLEAYDLYLQAKQLVARVDAISLPSNEQKDLAEAIDLLTEATRKDPNFAIGYCLIAKAHDLLYFDLVDHTPERRALGDAAVQEALRLRPDLPQAHFAAAFHYYACHQDLERARTHISIAAKFSPNDPDLLRVMSIIDQAQGQWSKPLKLWRKRLIWIPEILSFSSR